MCITVTSTQLRALTRPRVVWKVMRLHFYAYSDSPKLVSCYCSGNLQTPVLGYKPPSDKFGWEISYKLNQLSKSPIPQTPGLYCFTTRKEAQKHAKSLTFTDVNRRVAVRCLAPAEATYFYGTAYGKKCINVSELTPLTIIE